MRLDVYLVKSGALNSREQAKEAVTGGFVTVNGVACKKPSYDISDNDMVVFNGEKPRYAGRGGYKLEHALKAFAVNVSGKVCLDIGASTGGFTDCMLQNGAALVYALDVGHGQLKISDARLKNMERTDIRNVNISDFKPPPEFITADVSFISLKLILPKIKELLPKGGEAVVLIKPQFEAGREHIGKNGLVKSMKAHQRVLADMITFCIGNELAVTALDFSPIKGGSGNIEYLAKLIN
ncbi:MAG: TlyA family RNA methyltransferase [Oscillospiraceae bacterium]|nr:TlyA family RNA methyltransferase [Oscillospiraceae bacterium]